MGYFLEGLKQAIHLLFPPSGEVLEIVGLSLLVSGAATVLAAAAGVPFGLWLSLAEFRGRRALVGLVPEEDEAGLVAQADGGLDVAVIGAQHALNGNGAGELGAEKAQEVGDQTEFVIAGGGEAGG